MRRQRSSAPALIGGMSLIEVLVAFVILSMVMSVILRINATSLRNHEVSKQYLNAVRIAESRMVEMGMDAQSLSLVRDGVDKAGYRWEFVRQPYTDWNEEKLQGLPVEPVEERIEVAWGEGDSPRRVSFSRINLIYRSR
jgi:general secretion pathway protein I